MLSPLMATTVKKFCPLPSVRLKTLLCVPPPGSLAITVIVAVPLPLNGFEIRSWKLPLGTLMVIFVSEPVSAATDACPLLEATSVLVEEVNWTVIPDWFVWPKTLAPEALALNWTFSSSGCGLLPIVNVIPAWTDDVRKKIAGNVNLHIRNQLHPKRGIPGMKSAGPATVLVTRRPAQALLFKPLPPLTPPEIDQSRAVHPSKQILHPTKPAT